MLGLKACPRCRGDLVIAPSLEGRSANCLQCGYTADRVSVAAHRPAARPSPGVGQQRATVAPRAD